jgi:two-component system invasion response regulator UvrY
MIRVGIVDDHAVVRAGLKQLLSDEVDLRVTGEASDGAGALRLAQQGEVDVLLMDLAMPDQSGVDALAAVKARFPDLPVVILSGYPETHYATTLLKQGASGYLSKECDPQQIVEAIRTVARGRRFITPAVAELLADQVTGNADRLPHEALSERELQVFLHLAQGKTVGQLADSMCLSVKTISTYRTRVLDKLKLRTNSDLTYYALKNGLIR